MWYRHFINHEKFYVCDLDLKVSEEVGVEMEQHKHLDQYLTSGNVKYHLDPFKGSRVIHF